MESQAKLADSTPPSAVQDSVQSLQDGNSNSNAVFQVPIPRQPLRAAVTDDLTLWVTTTDACGDIFAARARMDTETAGFPWIWLLAGTSRRVLAK